ncbi:MAG: hypothetical protein ACI85O_001349 [Saprospiraceae bacterium]|jgi:hypothetical protein
MQNQYRYFILFPLLLISFCLLGQENQMSLPMEEVTLHTDRNLYLTKEKVYFKAFCKTEGKLESPLSQTLYVELFDYKSQTFIQKKYALKNGVSVGSFTVPEELRTDNYYLRAYTAYQRNFEASTYFQKTLKLINPTTTGKSIVNTGSAKPIKDKMAETKLETNALFAISIDKESYSPREKVDLNIDFPSDFVSASVAVRPVAAGKSEGRFIQPMSVKLMEDTLRFLPELRGFGISGLLQNPETKEPLTDIQCIISALGDKSQVHATQTNKEGIFTFQLSNLQEEQTLFIGTPKGKTSAKLLILSDFANDFSEYNREVLSFDSLQHAYVEDLFLQQQLLDVFPPKVLKVSDPQHTIKRFSNLDKPDITVLTSDFIDLVSLEEIFRDIVPTVSVKGRVNARNLTVYNPETNQTFSDPLVLLDNVPVNDIDALLKVSPSKLERIEVISSNYRLGDYLFGGIILLHTNTNNFADYKWSNASAFIEYKTLTASKSFKQVVYDVQEKNNSYPDFRSTLYWNPNVTKINNNLTFYTSDYCTEYEIVVRGFNRNGNYGEKKVLFMVDR